MKFDFQPLIDAVYKLVDRVGSKCAVAIGALIFLGYSIHAAVVPPLIGVVGMAVIAIGYFIADTIYKLKTEGECSCDAEEKTTDTPDLGSGLTPTG